MDNCYPGYHKRSKNWKADCKDTQLTNFPVLSYLFLNMTKKRIVSAGLVSTNYVIIKFYYTNDDVY